jgi:lipopolysaccharide transport system ATP-binding protein
MGGDVVICAEGLGKRYLIGHQAEAERYTALRDVIARSARGLARSAADMLRGRPLTAGDTVEEFWALKEVSFEVKRGEVVGIIGRNGAGKSTLLKVLSRITEPSTGRITIKGRVASLLEVGTGFHPELTGRENIYLNGAILGMSRAEIRAKFDEIVAFAEVEKFLDTPVKRYSSGMYVRLAFAVAAHLEPEILIVDEVLAVGDAEFQKRCLGKMGEVASSGRTVLFVSHNADALRRLCKSGIYLSSGRMMLHSDADTCIDAYLTAALGNGHNYMTELPSTQTSRPHLTRIEILDRDGNPNPTPATWSYVKFRVCFSSPILVRVASVVVYISTSNGTLLTFFQTSPDSGQPMSIHEGEGFVDCDVPCLPLSAGSFIIGAGLAIPNVEWFDTQPHAAIFHVEQCDVFASGMVPRTSRYPIAIPHAWYFGAPPRDVATSSVGGTTAGSELVKGSSSPA